MATIPPNSRNLWPSRALGERINPPLSGFNTSQDVYDQQLASQTSASGAAIEDMRRMTETLRRNNNNINVDRQFNDYYRNIVIGPGAYGIRDAITPYESTSMSMYALLVKQHSNISTQLKNRFHESWLRNIRIHFSEHQQYSIEVTHIRNIVPNQDSLGFQVTGLVRDTGSANPEVILSPDYSGEALANPYFGQNNPIDIACNKPTEIRFNNKIEIWPWYMVEMCEHVSESYRENPNDILIESNGIRRLVATLNDTITFYSPLLWLLQPNEVMRDYIKDEVNRVVRRQMVERVKRIRRARTADLDQEARRLMREYQDTIRAQELTRISDDEMAERMVKSIQDATKDDAQVIATYMDGNGHMRALVGPIITAKECTGKPRDYGYFLLDLDQRKSAFAFYDWNRGHHTNMSGSNSEFCMGDVGTDEYHKLIGKAEYTAAISFFIYRIGHPGGRGYHEHDPEFSPLKPENLRAQINGFIRDHQNDALFTAKSEKQLDELVGKSHGGNSGVISPTISTEESDDYDEDYDPDDD